MTEKTAQLKIRRKRIGRSASSMVYDVVLSAVAVTIAAVCIYPVVHTIFASVSNPEFVRLHQGLILYPRGFSFNGYRMLFQNAALTRSMLNSLIYVFAGTALNMVLTVMGGYALSRREALLNKAFMKLIVFTMFFSGGLLPLYMLIGELRMIDTRWAVIVPAAVSQWNLILMRTAFIGVPEEMAESAKIDGANHFIIMLNIMLPLVMSTFAIVTLYYVIGHWNSWFSAMAFLRRRDLFPMQLVLREILVVNDSSQILNIDFIKTEDKLNYEALIKYTSVVVTMLPMFIIFPFVQKSFTRGVMLGSLKS